MNQLSQTPIGKPMRLMSRAEKIAEFQRQINDVTSDEASTPHGKAYLAHVRSQLKRVEDSSE